MKHIDVFILYKYGPNVFPEINKEAYQFILRSQGMLNAHDSFQETMQYYFNKPPKTKYIVHALKNKGFSQIIIAEWLGISQASVSYHLQKPLDSEYKNQTITHHLQ